MSYELQWLLRTYNSVAHLVVVQDGSCSAAVCNETPVGTNWISPDPDVPFHKCAECQQADDSGDEITIAGPDFSRVVVRPARNN